MTANSRSDDQDDTDHLEEELEDLERHGQVLAMELSRVQFPDVTELSQVQFQDVMTEGKGAAVVAAPPPAFGSEDSDPLLNEAKEEDGDDSANVIPETPTAVTEEAVVAVETVDENDTSTEEESSSDHVVNVTSQSKQDHHAGRLGISTMQSPSDEEKEETSFEEEEQEPGEDSAPTMEVKTLHPVQEDASKNDIVFEDDDARSVRSSSSAAASIAQQPSVASSAGSQRSIYSNGSSRSRKSLAISMDGALHEIERRQDSALDLIKKRRKTIESFRNGGLVEDNEEGVIFLLDPEVCQTFGSCKELPAPKGAIVGGDEEDTLATDGNDTYQSTLANIHKNIAAAQDKQNKETWQRRKQRRCIMLGLLLLVSSVTAVACYLLVSRSQSTTSASAATVQQAPTTTTTTMSSKSCLLQRTVQDPQDIQLEITMPGISDYLGPTQERQVELAVKAAFNQAVGGEDGCNDIVLNRWMVRADLAHQALLRDFVVREEQPPRPEPLQPVEQTNTDTETASSSSSSSFHTVLADTSVLVTRFHTEISCQGCVAEQAFASVYPSFFGDDYDTDNDDGAPSSSFLKDDDKDDDNAERRMIRRRQTTEDLLEEEQAQQSELNAGMIVETIERVMKTILPNLEGFDKVTIVASSADGSTSAVTMQRSGSTSDTKEDNGNDREDAVVSEGGGNDNESAYGFTSGGGYRPSFARNQIFDKVSTILDCATITRPRKKRKKGSKSDKSNKSSKSEKSEKSSKDDKSSKSKKSSKSSSSSISKENPQDSSHDHKGSPSSSTASDDTDSHDEGSKPGSSDKDHAGSTDDADDSQDEGSKPSSSDKDHTGSTDDAEADGATGSMDMDDDTLSFSEEEEKEDGAYSWYTDVPSPSPNADDSTFNNVGSTPTVSPNPPPLPTPPPFQVPSAAPSDATGTFPLPTKTPSVSLPTAAPSKTPSVSLPTATPSAPPTDEDELTGRIPGSDTGPNDIWRRCGPEYDDEDATDEDFGGLVGRLDNPPCSVCGPDQTVTKFSAIVSSSLSGQGTSTCGLLQLAGTMGHLRADVCAVLPTTIKDVCGCAPE